ncbi:lysine-rich arabinogalactan protein 19-like [Ursus americanus]|uniref:lysine-rich arabinogalactan protein 19-like n=1 Tax=Ursus americanus TaxID=9643 RepID=UPI001E67D08E|nr:lysine-rich arabinogalactan protein 19-like [Ursus americanus]
MRESAATARSSPTPGTPDPAPTPGASASLRARPRPAAPRLRTAAPRLGAPAPWAVPRSSVTRWVPNPCPRAPTLHPRALRGLAALGKVPAAAPSPPQPPICRDRRTAPRLRVRKRQRGDFRPGQCSDGKTKTPTGPSSSPAPQ